MLGGRLPETENKRKCQISGLKSGRGRLGVDHLIFDGGVAGFLDC